MRYWHHGLCAALCLGVLAPIAGAVVINVPNFSFEAPNTIDSGGAGLLGSGWSYGPTGGPAGAVIFDPTDFQFPGATGNNTPLPGTAHGGQCLEVMVGLDFSDITWVYPSSPLDTIAANSRYRLTVSVGQAVPWDTADAIISLFAGTTIVGSATVKADNIPEGTFLDYTTSFDAEIGNPIVGLPLSLELRADRAGRALRPPPGEQPLWVFFDNVRLTSEALPEPGTLTMIASLGAILLCRRK